MYLDPGSENTIPRKAPPREFTVVCRNCNFATSVGCPECEVCASTSHPDCIQLFWGHLVNAGSELAGKVVGAVRMSALQGAVSFGAGLARGVKAAVAPVMELQDDFNVIVNDSAPRELAQRMSLGEQSLTL